MDLFNDTVQYVLNTDIPTKILEDTFLPNKNSPDRNRSLGDCIIEKVIRNRIMPALNALGGTIIDVPLWECKFEYDSTFQYRYHRHYEVAERFTQNRPINAVLRAFNMGVVTSPTGIGAGGIGVSAYQTSDADEMVRKQIETYGRAVQFSDSDIEVIGDNIIRVTNTIMQTYNLSLECRVGYSREFHELTRPYHIDFFRLANIATKAYIYKEQRILIDQFKNDGGRELGAYSEFINQYSDANEQYLEEIAKRWGKLLILGDQRRAEKARQTGGRSFL